MIFLRLLELRRFCIASPGDTLLRNPITGVGCCARREQPCNRAAEQRDELAPFQTACGSSTTEAVKAHHGACPLRLERSGQIAGSLGMYA